MTQGSHGGAVPRSREKGSKEEVDEPSRQAGPLKRRFERPRASTQLTFAEGSIDTLEVVKPKGKRPIDKIWDFD